MANLLYLVHRLPYPPNKGDKVRSYHLLKHLAASHNVYLGTFVDDSDDMQYLPVVREMCAGLCAVPLSPVVAKLRSLWGLLNREPLTLAYYRDAGLRRWIAATRSKQHMDGIVVFSSAMAQYVPIGGSHAEIPLLIDLVDVDSAKWTQYADQHRWPMSWVYRREGTTLLKFERAQVARASKSFLVTERECGLFLQHAPESAGSIEVIGNGVDSDYYAPDPLRASPFQPGQVPLVFTGAMDYWPNIDAAVWFCHEVMPLLYQRWPNLHFVIVGRNPPTAIQSLASATVTVTGTVPDVRPYLQHAAVVVAPMRIARGVQNKILEAMAMARPVVAASQCVTAIDELARSDLFPALDVQDYVDQIAGLLLDQDSASAAGQRGRQCVVRHYSWSARLSAMDKYLPARHQPALAPVGSVTV